ncbi:hypothetical protein ACSMX9_19265 [Streptomyces sp. LE64]|uniref:hypothetical protein n=1 Tax=Streptomyces sp. LE64 TaxID=3448653 RepID=UPI00404285B2
MRLLYVSEGSSDQGLRPHIECIAAEAGRRIVLTTPQFARLSGRVGHSVVDKLRAARDLDGSYDVVLVHRDADNQGADLRHSEISSAVAAVWQDMPYVPVIPIKSLEAWLLVDEQLIRLIAGNPCGKVDLKLPKGRAVERVADPKQLLKETLAIASGLKGRKLEIFQKRFAQNRHRLLELMDPAGPVSEVPSWNAFVNSLRAVFQTPESSRDS